MGNFLSQKNFIFFIALSGFHADRTAASRSAKGTAVCFLLALWGITSPVKNDCFTEQRAFFQPEAPVQKALGLPLDLD